MPFLHRIVLLKSLWIGIVILLITSACTHPPVPYMPPEPLTPGPAPLFFTGQDGSAFYDLKTDASGRIWLAGYVTLAGVRQPWLVAMDSAGQVLQSYTGNCSGNSEYRTLVMESGLLRMTTGHNDDLFGQYGIRTMLNPAPTGCDELLSRINSDWRIFDYLQSSSGSHYYVGDINTLGNRSLCIVVADSMAGTHTLKTYGGSFIDAAVRILETTSGDIWVLAHTESRGHGSRDLWLLQVDSQGDTLQTFTLGGAGYEQASGFLEMPGGDFLVVGHSASVDPMHDNYIVRVSPAGNIRWQLHLGGPNHDGTEDVIALGNDTYLVLANTESHGTESNVTLLKISGSGTLIDTVLITTGSFDTGLRLARYGGHFWVCGQLMEAGITRAFVYRNKEF